MSVDMKVKAIYDSEIGNITRTDKSWMDARCIAGILRKAMENRAGKEPADVCFGA